MNSNLFDAGQLNPGDIFRYPEGNGLYLRLVDEDDRVRGVTVKTGIIVEFPRFEVVQRVKARVICED